MDWADPIRVEDSLQALADWNLVVALPQAPSGPRLRMLETIREYGLERLSLSGAEEATRDRHARFFLELAERAEPELRGAGQADWIAGGRRRTTTISVKRSDGSRRTRRSSGAFASWARSGASGRSAASSQRDASTPNGCWRSTAARPTPQRGRGRSRAPGGSPSSRATTVPRGDSSSAASRSSGRCGDAAETALLLVNLGMLANVEGRRDDARALLQRGAEAFRAISDAWGEANALAYLGSARAERRRPRYALASCFSRSLELAGAAGEKRMAAFSLTQLGAIAREAGEDDARRAALRAGTHGAARARRHVEHRLIVDQSRRAGAEAGRKRPSAGAARAEPRSAVGGGQPSRDRREPGAPRRGRARSATTPSARSD